MSEPPSFPLIVTSFRSHSHIRKRKDAAVWCVRDGEAICKQLEFIRGQFSQLLRLEDWSEIAFACQFYLENYYFRAYTLQERLWELVFILTRRPTSRVDKEQAREEALEKLRRDDAQLAGEFSKVFDRLQVEIELRNIITHEGFVQPVVVLAPVTGKEDDFLSLDEVFEVEFQDPQRREQATPQRVRAALERYIQEQEEHTEWIMQAGADMLELCKTAIEHKKW